ncbi:MAG: sensor histidine kinase [Myxococcota bacterium]
MLRWNAMDQHPGDWRDLRRAMRDARRAARRARMGGYGLAPRQDLTPEQRALRDAKRAADARIGFLIHGTIYALVIFGILISGGFVAALTTAIFWGIGVASHFIAAIAGPELRKRWIEQQVAPRVVTETQQQRRDLEGEQARRVQRLSASLAHEIRNPITAAKSLVQQMGEDPAAAENVNYAQVALQELERVERSIAHLLKFAREEELKLASARLDEIVISALATLRDRMRDLGVKLETDTAGAGALTCDAEQLRRVVINLATNALDALRDAKTPAPRLRVAVGENLAGTEAWLSVRDNGPGIPAEHLPRLFDPFFTAKDGGTGLGLALAKKIVDAHGGTIETKSEPAHGAEFVVTLPKSRPSAGAQA